MPEMPNHSAEQMRPGGGVEKHTHIMTQQHVHSALT